MSNDVMALRKAARQFATSDNPRAWKELAGTLGLYVPAYLIAITQYANLWLFVPAMVITIRWRKRSKRWQQSATAFGVWWPTANLAKPISPCWTITIMVEWMGI